MLFGVCGLAFILLNFGYRSNDVLGSIDLHDT